MGNELPQIMGNCKFCGQSKLIQTIGEISKEKADEMVTLECECKEAKIYQNREGKIKKAQEWAQYRFENTPKITKLFNEIFEYVTNNEVEKVSVKEGEWTHNIFLDSDGFLNVKSSKKVEEEIEFS